MWLYKLAATAELVLVLLEATMHWTGLPLGGGHAQQIGILFGGACVLNEIAPGCRRLYGRVVRKAKNKESTNENDPQR